MRFLVVTFVGLFILSPSVPICSAGDSERVVKPKPSVAATPIEIPKPKREKEHRTVPAANRTKRSKPKPNVSATPIEIPKPRR